MPHLVILYTGQLDRETDMGLLCRRLADAMLTIKDEAGQPVFPTGGTRVLAYPAAHYAVADGGAAGRQAAQFNDHPHSGPNGSGDSSDYAFMYLNLRVGRGRTEATLQRAGQTLADVAHAHLAEVFGQRHIGITFQVDVGTEVFDNKHSNLHPLFNKS